MTTELNDLALQLEADDRFRVLRKIEPPRAREDCNLPAGARRIALVDVETTGLDARHDRIIELAIMAIDVDCDRGCAVLSNTVPMSWLEDPHRRLDERIVRLSAHSQIRTIERARHERAFSSLPFTRADGLDAETRRT